MSLIRSGKPPRALVLASAPEPSGPTAEFRQHHDVLPPTIDRKQRREAWLVSSRFARLNPDEATIRAADRFRRDYETARGARPPREKIAVDETDGGLCADDIRISASIKDTDTKHSLGSLAYSVLEDCLIYDLAWTTIGHTYGWDRETAREYTVLYLRGLVEYYEMIDNARKPRRRVTINTADCAETAVVAS